MTKSDKSSRNRFNATTGRLSYGSYATALRAQSMALPMESHETARIVTAAYSRCVYFFEKFGALILAIFTTSEPPVFAAELSDSNYAGDILQSMRVSPAMIKKGYSDGEDRSSYTRNAGRRGSLPQFYHSFRSHPCSLYISATFGGFQCLTAQAMDHLRYDGSLLEGKQVIGEYDPDRQVQIQPDSPITDVSNARLLNTPITFTCLTNSLSSMPS